MLPSEDELAAAYEVVAQRFALGPRVSRVALRVALREAEHLAEDVYETPAALFFVLARAPRAFEGHLTMTVVAALLQVASSGQTLRAPVRDLADLAPRVARGEVGYDTTRAYFGERLWPFAG